MSKGDKKERILTQAEVKKTLEDALARPDPVDFGPEEDVGIIKPEGMEESEEGEMEEAPKKEVSFEKRATLEHVSNFTRIDVKPAVKMIKDLVKIERVTEAHAYKIAELMPRDETELRPVFAKDRFTLTPEELKEIMDVIVKYL